MNDLNPPNLPYEPRPIYELVAPSDGTWKNRHRNARVTPPTPDYAQTSPSRTVNFRNFPDPKRIEEATSILDSQPRQSMQAETLNLNSCAHHYHQ